MTFRQGMVFAAILYAILLPFYTDHEIAELTEKAREHQSGRFVTLQEGITRFDVAGPADGELVVLVHGLSSPTFVWGELPGQLAEAGYRSLRYDLFGRGFSDRVSGAYDLDLYRNQLIELLQVVGVERRFHLVGLSMGGVIAVDYAASFPDRLASLTLIDPAGFPMAQPLAASLMQIPYLGEYLMKLVGDRALLSSVSKSFSDPSFVPGFQKLFARQLRWKGTKRAILSSLREMPMQTMASRYGDLGRNGVPTLLFWGSEDEVIPASNAAYVRSTVPMLRVIHVDGAGHLPHYEKPEVVGPAMLEFLADHKAPPKKPAQPRKRRDRKKARESE